MFKRFSNFIDIIIKDIFSTDMISGMDPCGDCGKLVSFDDLADAALGLCNECNKIRRDRGPGNYYK